MLEQSLCMCLCVLMKGVEDIMSSPGINTEWVMPGLGWISLTGEQSLSILTIWEWDEEIDSAQQGMSRRRLDDDDGDDDDTKSCADRSMKILENRMKH